jgi:hypothetical protein
MRDRLIFILEDLYDRIMKHFESNIFWNIGRNRLKFRSNIFN